MRKKKLLNVNYIGARTFRNPKAVKRKQNVKSKRKETM